MNIDQYKKTCTRCQYHGIPILKMGGLICRKCRLLLFYPGTEEYTARMHAHISEPMRYKAWWWGRYIFQRGTKWYDEKGEEFPKEQVNLKELEPYDEADHGTHHEKG